MDGFLLHNPEHYFDVPNPLQNDLQNHVVDSLHFLEGLVKNGVICYYAISSNTLPYRDKKNRLNIEKIISNNDSLRNFKLIQFPYNLIENNASNKNNKEKSLIDFCKQSNLKMFSNRPLNTVYQNKVLRLADYSEEIIKLDIIKEDKMFSNLISLIKEKLTKLGDNSDPTEFTPIKFFVENRKEIANPEAVNKAITNHLIPFLSQIELNNQQTFNLIKDLQEQWILYSKKFITERTTKLKYELISQKIIDNQDCRNLSTIACEHYLQKGIDHVLIGMRKKEIINVLFIFSFFLALTITIWLYYQMNNSVGDIKFDKNRDDSTFVICNEKKVFQYYSAKTSYIGERKEMRKEIYNFLKSDFIKEIDYSGYITFRFIVNCKGHSGMFRHKIVDKEFKKMNLSSETLKKLEMAIKSLKSWKAGSINNVVVDSYYQINFKIAKGQIIDVF